MASDGHTKADLGREAVDAGVIDIGRRIFALRQAHRYSLRDLAHMSGLSASFLSEVERGQGEPSISALKRIASALDVGLVYFFSAVRE